MTNDDTSVNAVILPDFEEEHHEEGLEPDAHEKFPYVFSPTQISTWLECNRKWGFRRLDRIKAPSAKSAELGTEGHTQLESYLRDGTPLDFTKPSGAIVAAGLHLLPEPKTAGLIYERQFRFQSPRTDFVYLGKKDIELPAGIPIVALEVPGDVPVVIDHKTTSSISKYAKEREDLLWDPQATIYAYDSMARYETPEVDMRWVYYQTRGAKRAEVRGLRMQSKHAVKVFLEIERVAENLAKAIAVKNTANDLTPNPKACSMYGGCPYAHVCNLSPKQRMQGLSKMSLIDDLKKRVQGAASVAATPAPEVELSKAVEQAVTQSAPVAINPPESALPPAPIVNDAEGDDEGETQASQEATSAEATEPKARKARQKKETMLPPPSAEAPLALSKGFTLYVNCIPVGKPAKFVDSIIAKVKENMKTQAGVEDYRMPDYARGAGMLALGVGAEVDALSGSTDLILDSRTPEGAVILQTLMAKAAHVVRGL